jgi:membrane protein insertase Oxa1/YidC/SpoIIIJ
LYSLNAITLSWGMTIIFFTLVYRLLLFPLQWRASQESKKPVGARPWIPLALLAIQMPVFISVYRAIPKITALKTAAFLWLPNLALADPTFLLPLAVVGLTLYQQSRQTTTTPIPKWVLPSMSFVFMAAMPSSLVIHSIVSMAVQLGGERLIARIG